jgi:septal ring factor EnvC (AmiA/AmiB activator)
MSHQQPETCPNSTTDSEPIPTIPDRSLETLSYDELLHRARRLSTLLNSKIDNIKELHERLEEAREQRRRANDCAQMFQKDCAVMEESITEFRRKSELIEAQRDALVEVIRTACQVAMDKVAKPEYTQA